MVDDDTIEFTAKKITGELCRTWRGFEPDEILAEAFIICKAYQEKDASYKVLKKAVMTKLGRMSLSNRLRGMTLSGSEGGVIDKSKITCEEIGDPPDSPKDNKELLDFLAQTGQGLNDTDRKLIMCIGINGFTYQEAGIEVGLTTQEAHRRYKEALKVLKDGARARGLSMADFL